MEFRYGLTSLQSGGIDGSTGLPTSLADVGEVFKDSMTMEVADGESTEFLSELSEDPIVIIDELGKTTLNFELMNTEAAECVKYMGGTLTASGGTANIWNRPTVAPNIEMSLQYVTKDGSTFTIHRAKIAAKLVHPVGKTGMARIGIIATVLKPDKGTDVPAMTIADVTLQP